MCCFRYTDLIVVNEDRKEPNGLLIMHLPNGPTLNFKLSSIMFEPDQDKNKKKSKKKSKKK
jgi:ribosome production factor 1